MLNRGKWEIVKHRQCDISISTVLIKLGLKLGVFLQFFNVVISLKNIVN